ncbi:hypothetical protein AnigIFM49718_004777 [Aspergillus niger]|nr:hypothetical protein AnigIFM49718_004777 [Aspergillus niger]
MKKVEVPTEVLKLAKWLQICTERHACQTLLRRTEAKASLRNEKREKLDRREVLHSSLIGNDYEVNYKGTPEALRCGGPKYRSLEAAIVLQSSLGPFVHGALWNVDHIQHLGRWKS